MDKLSWRVGIGGLSKQECLKEKKELLIEATIDLFAQEGFWNTSTANIAKHARVGTGTLFNYFPSKRDLIDSVYAQLQREMISYLEEGYPESGDAKSRFEHFGRRYAEWGVSNPVRFTLMEQLKLSNMVSTNTKRQLQEENQLARGGGRGSSQRGGLRRYFCRLRGLSFGLNHEYSHAFCYRSRFEG